MKYPAGSFVTEAFDPRGKSISEINTHGLPNGHLDVWPHRFHFLDSGGYTLRTLSMKFLKENPGAGKWDFYESPEHWAFLDQFAAFVQKHRVAIDHYATVDVIGDADLTYRNFRYLVDEHGLRPIPVIHFGTDPRWIKRYHSEGFDYQALGGMVAAAGFGLKPKMSEWVNACFRAGCDSSGNPVIKFHGFGLGHRAIIAHPWYSVDTSGWAKRADFGLILVPHRRGGKWVFEKPLPYEIAVSLWNPSKFQTGRSYYGLTFGEKRVIDAWLEHIQCPLGSLSDKSVIPGVTNSKGWRYVANARFFDMLVKSRPAWPWRMSAASLYKPRGFQ